MSAQVYPDVAQLVPHEGPMLLIGRVLDAGEQHLCAEVRIDADSMFADSDGVGAWVGIEYMAQAIAAHAGLMARQRGEPVKIGFLLGARRYQCDVSHFGLGSVLHVHVLHVLQGENGLAAFECKITSGTDAAGTDAGPAVPSLAHATITVYQPDNVNEFLQRSF